MGLDIERAVCSLGGLMVTMSMGKMADQGLLRRKPGMYIPLTCDNAGRSYRLP